MRFLSTILILPAALITIHLSAAAQSEVAPTAKPELTVEKIMRDPKWIGNSPNWVRWSEDSKSIYFWWNPENAESDSQYVVLRKGGEPRKLTFEERMSLPGHHGEYNRPRTKKVYEKDGDIFILEIRNGHIKQITNTVRRESGPRFTHDEKGVTFVYDRNLFRWRAEDGSITQITDFREGRERAEKDEPDTEYEKWLKNEELSLFGVLRERKERRELRDEREKAEEPERPREIYIGTEHVDNIRLSPDERFVTFRLEDRTENTKRTIIPRYVTESGHTETSEAYAKVGRPGSTYEHGIYDIERDTVYYVSTKSIPGIFDEPEYLLEYKTPQSDSVAEAGPTEASEEKRKPRDVRISGPSYSRDGTRAVVEIMSLDHKDRWIMSLHLETAELSLLDRQRDEAWIGGPGIWNWRGMNPLGWMSDDKRIWFQSEASGYSHLYTVNVETGEKKQLTAGNFEISNALLSHDKKHFYFTSNQVHPGERHFYRMPADGGPAEQITTMTGRNRVWMSPDEKTLAIRHSYSNRPWEGFVMDNKPGAEARQITRSLSDEFLSYPWRDPEIVTFTASDGVDVYARLFRPDNPEPQGPAVMFVHGAGYLQNAHKWWSSYFREYMFHNLLADNGYTVLDVDYRGSAGYGRDCRTAIYRHMGSGKDLSDYVDGATFLVEQYDVDPDRIGIYGGSYGGFLTLFAMFCEPDVFAAGAALRSVTDFAHYHHGYTSEILNVPYLDSLAFVRSSPIYFAEGLEGSLLICHGMNDDNVHLQDVVRLAQRLIELGKDNWELAVYPLEAHSFREPSSWTDEYKRIFKLFEQNLK